MKIDFTIGVTSCKEFSNLVDEVNDTIEFFNEEKNAIAVNVKYQAAVPMEDSVVHYAMIFFTYKEGYGKIKE